MFFWTCKRRFTVTAEKLSLHVRKCLLKFIFFQVNRSSLKSSSGTSKAVSAIQPEICHQCQKDWNKVLRWCEKFLKFQRNMFSFELWLWTRKGNSANCAWTYLQEVKILCSTSFKKECFFKKKHFHRCFKSILYKNGMAQNMLLIAGHLFYISKKLRQCYFCLKPL